LLFPGSGNPPNVLITGGAGFLGRHLTQRIAEAGARVTVIDDFSTGLRDGLTPSEHLRVVEGSVLDRTAIAEAAVNADLILHLAAVVGMRRVYADPAWTLRVSDEGTANVLEVTRGQPVLLMSSSALYGLESRELAVETDAISYELTLNYDGGRPGYACGKRMLEHHGKAAMASGRPVMILRPFNVVGPGQRSDFGMVLPGFVRCARNGAPVEIHDDGQQVRSFGDVHTFVECVLRLLVTREAWRPDSNPINVGTPVATSILDLAKIVLEETGSDSRLKFVPYEKVYPGKHDVRHRRPDIARLTGLIGDVAWRDIRSVVREFVATVPGTVVTAPGGTCGLCGSRAVTPLVSFDGTQVVSCEVCRSGFVAAQSKRRAEAEYARRYDADADSKKARTCWRLMETAELLGGCRRILDVGCGSGHFLNLAREAGLDTAGIELDEASVAAARGSGHTVYKQSASDGPWPEEARCDLVTCWDILEHLNLPGDALKWAALALKPGGLLVVATPFLGSIYDKLALALHRATMGKAAQLLRMCWSADHLYRFHVNGLVEVVRRGGFEDVTAERRLMLSLRPDRYAGGAILPNWTSVGPIDHALSRLGVAVSKTFGFSNKMILVARKM
jgi:UDP-glucose 4-epimerase